VAIAAAVTSYARIHMIDFIDNSDVVYTDTDSIFATKLLDNNLVGKDLGLMKDEKNGNIIEEAYFFGIKQYGYTYRDFTTSDGNRHSYLPCDWFTYVDSSVFAGIKRNTLKIYDIKG
jgi:hypothetical protein